MTTTKLHKVDGNKLDTLLLAASELTGYSFDGLDLSGKVFKAVDFTGSSLKKVKVDENTVFQGCNFTDTDLTGIVGKDGGSATCADWRWSYGDPVGFELPASL